MRLLTAPGAEAPWNLSGSIHTLSGVKDTSLDATCEGFTALKLDKAATATGGSVLSKYVGRVGGLLHAHRRYPVSLLYVTRLYKLPSALRRLYPQHACIIWIDVHGIVAQVHGSPFVGDHLAHAIGIVKKIALSSSQKECHNPPSERKSPAQFDLSAAAGEPDRRLGADEDFPRSSITVASTSSSSHQHDHDQPCPTRRYFAALAVTLVP